MNLLKNKDIKSQDVGVITSCEAQKIKLQNEITYQARVNFTEANNLLKTFFSNTQKSSTFLLIEDIKKIISRVQLILKLSTKRAW